jgi:hypothetical protein
MASLRALLHANDTKQRLVELQQDGSASDQALLDAGNSQARIETLRAGLGAVHDGMATVQLETVIEKLIHVRYHAETCFYLSFKNCKRSWVLRSRLSAIQR